MFLEHNTITSLPKFIQIVLTALKVGKGTTKRRNNESSTLVNINFQRKHFPVTIPTINTKQCQLCKLTFTVDAY